MSLLQNSKYCFSSKLTNEQFKMLAQNLNLSRVYQLSHIFNVVISKTSQAVVRSLLFKTCHTTNTSVTAFVPFIFSQILHFGRTELNSPRDIILQQIHHPKGQQYKDFQCSDSSSTFCFTFHFSFLFQTGANTTSYARLS